MLLYVVEWDSNVKKVYLQTSKVVGNGNKLQLYIYIFLGVNFDKSTIKL